MISVKGLPYRILGKLPIGEFTRSELKRQGFDGECYLLKPTNVPAGTARCNILAYRRAETTFVPRYVASSMNNVEILDL